MIDGSTGSTRSSAKARTRRRCSPSCASSCARPRRGRASRETSGRSERSSAARRRWRVTIVATRDRALGRGREPRREKGPMAGDWQRARQRRRREGHRRQPHPHRSRPHLDSAALARPRGGDLLRARRLRPLVAGRGRLRGARRRHDRASRRPRGAHAARGAGRPRGARVRHASRAGVRLAAALEGDALRLRVDGGSVDDPWDIEAEVGELEFAEPGDRRSNVVASRT